MYLRLPMAAIAALLVGATQVAAADRETDARLDMVRTIEVIAPQSSSGATATTLDAGVLEAMRRVPRHAFVPASQRELAYTNRPLPIGYGQTISQPYIVALMTDLLRLAQHSRALEIGTGSGYQAAVLAELGHQVYTIEIVSELAELAVKRLSGLGYDTVSARRGDGYYGWPDAAPFDGIVVTAAASQIPPPLLEQLKLGGRMVIPIGAAFLVQELMLVEKLADGTIRTEALLPSPLCRSLAGISDAIARSRLAALAAAIGYEIVLKRLFAIALWHHFAYMIISLALLGYGASGT